MMEVTNVGQVISTKITSIVAEFEAIPKLSAKNEHAAFCNCLAVIFEELRDAGHHVPQLLPLWLARLAGSAPEVPNSHTDKMFTVNSGGDQPRDPAGFPDRMKRMLPIALVNLLVSKGATPGAAKHRVADACDIDVRKLKGQHKRTGLASMNSDQEEQLKHASKYVEREYSKLLLSMGSADALTILIKGVAALRRKL